MKAELLIAEKLLLRNPPKLIRTCIESDLIVDNPAFTQAKKDERWTGGIPPKLFAYEQVGKDLVVPYGYGAKLTQVAKKYNITLDTQDLTVKPHLDISFHGTLRPYQVPAVEEVSRWRCGSLVAPTGSGKTATAMGLIARLQTTTLIIVHTSELFEQTADAVRKFLCLEPGLIGRGKWDPQPITVAMLQTLSKRDLKPLSEEYGCLISDESHHSASPSWREALGSFRARHRYGLTATNWRKDGLSQLIRHTIGPTRYTIRYQDLDGAVLTPEVVKVETGWTSATDNFHELHREIANSRPRNRLIVKLAKQYENEGPLLILVNRIEHANNLERLLPAAHPVVLTGELSGKRRKEAFEQVKAGAPLTIATLSLLSEGVDVPGWSVLILAAPVAGGPRTIQSFGRVMRPADGKDRAIVVDLVDDHGFCQAASRLRDVVVNRNILKNVI